MSFLRKQSFPLNFMFKKRIETVIHDTARSHLCHTSRATMTDHFPRQHTATTPCELVCCAKHLKPLRLVPHVGKRVLGTNPAGHSSAANLITQPGSPIVYVCTCVCMSVCWCCCCVVVTLHSPRRQHRRYSCTRTP